MEKSNNHKLLSFKEWGYGKIAKCLYEFLITDDYQATISMEVSDETHKKTVATPSVPLKEDEVRLVDMFVESLIQPQQSKKGFMEDPEIPYEGQSIESFDLKIVDDYLLKSKFNLLKDLIQGNHSELSMESVISMYNDLCNQIGKGSSSTKSI